jgi:hypothetical protein
VTGSACGASSTAEGARWGEMLGHTTASSETAAQGLAVRRLLLTIQSAGNAEQDRDSKLLPGGMGRGPQPKQRMLADWLYSVKVRSQLTNKTRRGGFQQISQLTLFIRLQNKLLIIRGGCYFLNCHRRITTLSKKQNGNSAEETESAGELRAPKYWSKILRIQK